MGKISNYTIFTTTIILLITVVVCASVVKINKIHEEKLMYAIETKVEYFAKRCYLENNCTGEITLNNLYERQYLGEIINPVTKEIIDYSTKITYVDNQINIEWK